MGKVNRNISFDKDFLNKLKNDPNSSVEIHKETYHLALYPFHLSDLNSSIKEILNEKIAKYDKNIGGILLGYQNIKLLDNAGAINFDSCYIHTNIQADFYVFNPIVTQILNGVVNKKSKDHVGCLVHKTFNVSLPNPDDSENWMGHLVQLGQEIQFEITFTDLNGKLPYIKGKILSILSDDSGFSTSEEPNGKEVHKNIVIKFEDSDTEIPHKIKEKKKRKRESSTSINEVEIVTKKIKSNNISENCESETYKIPKKHKHKEKKHKHVDTNKVSELVTDGDTIKKKLKKKKQHKHSGDSNIESIYESELRTNISNWDDNNFKDKKKKKKHKHSLEMEVDDINVQSEQSKSEVIKKHGLNDLEQKICAIDVNVNETTLEHNSPIELSHTIYVKKKKKKSNKN